jgi:hypothetical protein
MYVKKGNHGQDGSHYRVQVARQMKQTYEWILGGGSAPPWVQIV